MAVANGHRPLVFKDMGLVSQAFNEPTDRAGRQRPADRRGGRLPRRRLARLPVPGGAGGGRRPRRHWTRQAAVQGLFHGSYPIPIPDATGPDLRPSAATQPSTLPLPNP